MKLLACHIDNFGKLSDVTLQFSDGLNVINEANAWGKSTLAAFLKAMFYGLDAKKSAGAFDKERVMYRPWQGGAFGGEVDFEVNGKKYRISRSFGKTDKADEFHVYDLRTNIESLDFSEDIGNELFGLDSASFKRSIYIAQNECASEASDGINAKLGNLAENTDDINNFESANQQLKEMLNQLTPDRVTGSIKKRKNSITQLAQELRSFEAASTGMEGIAQKEQQVSEQIQELLKVRKNYADALVAASEDSRRKALYAQYDALCQEVVEKEQKRDTYQNLFPVGVPSEAEFQTQVQNISRMSETQAAARGHEFSIEEMEEYSKLQEMFEHKIPSDADINAALQMFVEIDKQKEEIARQESKLSVYHTDLAQVPMEPKFSGAIAYMVFLFVGIGTAFLGLCTTLAWYYKWFPMIDSRWLFFAAVVLGACGAAFGIIGGVLGMRVGKDKETWQAMMDAEQENLEGKAKVLTNTISSMKEDVRKVYSTIGKFLANYHVYCDVAEYQSKVYGLKGQVQEYLRLCEKRANYEKEIAAYQEIRGKLVNFVKLYQLDLGEDVTYSLNQLQAKVAEYQMAEAAYQEAYQKRADFEAKQDKAFWTKQAFCPYSLEELHVWIAEADEKLEGLKAAKNQYTKQMEDLQEQLDLRDEKEQELKEMQLAQEKDMRKYHILKLTQEFMQQAKEQFTARYMEPISQAFGKYYGMLTGDDKQSWMIDANINVKIKEQGELRETHWLSAGYQDLIGVCMRLALVDAMYQEEKPFLILDDPFVNLDQEKVKAGNELLLSVGKEYQIIYFTCHDSRSPKIV
ncbi:MAG: AAA family ATPase [Agathobacter sp.]|nr:AAA family ATPase [Agathobacter sp.]